jgi:hypothetical protein
MSLKLNPPKTEPLGNLAVGSMQEMIRRAASGKYLFIRNAVYDTFVLSDFESEYSTTGAPAINPRIKVSALLYKEIFNLSDKKVIEDCTLNLGVKCMVGLDDGGTICEKPLGNFRNRFMRDETSNICRIVKALTIKMGEALGIDMSEQRCDTTYFRSGTAIRDRVGIVRDTLAKCSAAIPEGLVPHWLEEFLTDRFESYITYYCKESKIEKLGFLLDKCHFIIYHLW